MKRNRFSRMAINPCLTYGSNIYSHKLQRRNNKAGRSFTCLASLFLLILLMGYSTITFSQPPPPPQHGTLENQSPSESGAPVGSGTLILIVLAAAYAGKKVYQLRLKSTEKSD